MAKHRYANADSPASRAMSKLPGFGLVKVWRDIARLRTETPGLTAYMQHRRHGAVVPTPTTRWVSISQVSPYALCAIVGAEDPFFFEHHGVWWRQVAFKLISAALGAKRIGGVSTITQQLARNLYLSEQRSVGRKLRETMLAFGLERALTKSRILELYVNVVEWGPGTWGIEDAAETYFGTTASALNAFQAVVLASLLPAPRAPLAGNNLGRATASQYRLLHFLYGAGVMTVQEWGETGERVLQLRKSLGAGMDSKRVLRELGDRSYRGSGDQRESPSSADLLESRCGLQLRIAYTTILQGAADRRMRVPKLPFRWTGRLGE